MTSLCEINDLISIMSRIAPGGVKIYLCIEEGKPLRSFIRMDEKTHRILRSRNAELQDPAMVWGLNNDGVTLWSQNKIHDPYKNLDVLKRSGLTYGATWAIGNRSKRSVMSALRSDRDFKIEEAILATNALSAAHDAMSIKKYLTAGQIDALRLVGLGDRHAQASVKLGISESGFKSRLKSARIELDARTTAEAICTARDLGLI
jgi:LuxR family transcriptional regulator